MRDVPWMAPWGEDLEWLPLMVEIHEEQDLSWREVMKLTQKQRL